jgi:uncharacterized membrane protein
VLSLIFEGIAIFLNILGYVYFSSGDGCGNSLWVNIITTIIIVILPFLQLLHFNAQNSLLTTALVSVYITYLAFIGQFSYGNQCNPYLIKAPAESQSALLRLTSLYLLSSSWSPCTAVSWAAQDR